MKKTHSKSFKLLLLAMLMLDMEAIGQQILIPVKKNRTVAARQSGSRQQIPSIKGIKAMTDKLLEKEPRQKVYVQTDKHEYNVGDTIWLKAYVLDAAYLSAAVNSRLLFVELHNDSAEVVRRVSVVLKDGLGNAQIPLTEEIFKEGGYSIRAYTQWMRRFGADGTYSKHFYLGKASKNSWLVSSGLAMTGTPGTERMEGWIGFSDLDRMPVGLRQLELKIMEDDITRRKDVVETNLEGKIFFKYEPGSKRNGSRMRLEVRDLRKNGNQQVLRIPLDINRAVKTDLQFLPEGGGLVAGMRSVIAFKAIGENGRSVKVTGKVFDAKGLEVADFESSAQGMGTFEFTPMARQQYIARLDSPISGSKTYKLPVAKPTGTVMHIDNPEQGDSVIVNLKASSDVVAAGGAYYLIGSARGVVCYGIPFYMKSNKTISVAKRLFPSGIARFTLMSGTKPLNERVVFIEHGDALKVKMSTTKSTYLKRDSVSVEIEVSDQDGNPVSGSFSLAVTDDDKVMPDRFNNFGIRTSLLLNSNLKGMVENPGFYLSRKDPVVWNALDELLLTQGWTGFDWNDVFDAESPEVKKTDGRLIPSKYIAFPENRTYASQSWFVNGDGRSLNYAKSTMNKVNEYINYSGNMLKEVIIRSKKRSYNGLNLNGDGYADLVLDSSDIALSETKGLYDLLKQKVPSLRIEYFTMGQMQGYGLKVGKQWIKIQRGESDWGQKASRPREVMVSDSPQGLKNMLNTIKVHNISTLEFLYNQKYLAKYFPADTAKAFAATKFEPGARARLVAASAEAGVSPPTGEVKEYAVIVVNDSKVQRTDPNPNSIVPARKFYRPKYNVENNPAVADLRSTIHWEPDIVTDKNGKATVTFYTADQPGTYTLNLQGCDFQGHAGSGSHQFQVTLLQ